MSLADKYKHLDLSDKYKDLDQSASTSQATPDSSEPGYLESLARGAEQGLTFGFGDELNAALESATSDKKYSQALEESRQKFNAAEQANPITSMGGNILGSLVPGGMIAKGIGAGATAIRGASALADAGAIQKLAQLAQLGSEGQGGIKGLATIGALTGGAEGALQGVGGAEDKTQGLKDIPLNAAVGSGLGAAGGAAFGLGKKALDAFTGLHPVAESLQSYNYMKGKGGKINPLDKLEQDVFLGKDGAESAMSKASKDVVDTTHNTLNALEGSKEAGLLSDVDGKNLDIGDTLEKFPRKISNEGEKQAAEDLNLLTAKAEEVRNSLGDNYEKLKTLPDETLELSKQLQTAQKNLEKKPTIIENKFPTHIENKRMELISNLKDIFNDPESLESLSLNAPASVKNKLGDITQSLNTLLQDADPDKITEAFKNNQDLKTLLSDKNLMEMIKKSSSGDLSKGMALKEIKSNLSTLSNRHLMQQSEVPNQKAIQEVELAKQKLAESLNKHGIQLDSVEDLPNLMSKAKSLDQLNSELIKQQKVVGSLQPKELYGDFNPDMITPTEKSKMIDLSDKFNNLKQQYGDFQNLDKDSAKKLLGDLKTLKGNLPPQDQYPNLNKMFKDITDSMYEQMGDSNYKTINQMMSKGLDTIENLSGERSTRVGNFTKFGDQELHNTNPEYAKQLSNIMTNIKTPPNAGDKPKLELAKMGAEDIQKLFGSLDPEMQQQVTNTLKQKGLDLNSLQDVIGNLKDTKEIEKYYAAGATRNHINPFSEYYTKGWAGQLGSNAAKPGNIVNLSEKAATFAADKAVSPLYSQAVADKASQVSPTLAKLYERLLSPDLPDAKRRALHNILLNNPMMRKILAEEHHSE